MSRSLQQKLISFIVLGGSFVCMCVFIYWSGSWDLLQSVLTGANIGWLLASLACILIYLALELLSLKISLHISGASVRVRSLIVTTMVGQFFAAVTPLQAGAQPAQAVALAFRGVSVGKTASSLLSKFVIYQAVVTVCAALLLICRLDFFTKAHGSFALLALVGFAVHIVAFVFLTASGLFPGFVKRVAHPCVHFCARRSWGVKDKDAVLSKIDREVETFAHSFRELSQHKLAICSISLITALQLLSLYVIPFMMIRLLGHSDVDLITTLAAAAFVLLIQSAVPLPGGSGGAEGSFAVFFGFFLSDPGQTAVALLLWRVVTLYVPTVLGAPFVGALRRKNKSQGSALASE